MSSKSKFIIPTVSVGNIPQLTVDVVLANDSDFVLIDNDNIVDDKLLKFTYPFAGGNNNSNKIVKAIEIYENKKTNTFVLQQRAPIIKGFEINFYTLLVERVKTIIPHIAEVIILDSLSGSDPYIDLIKSSTISNIYELMDTQRIAMGHLNAGVDNKFFEKAKAAIETHIQTVSRREVNEQEYEDIGFQFDEVLPITDDKVITFASNSFQGKMFVDSLATQIIACFVNISTNINYFNMLSYEGDNSVDAFVFTGLLISLGLVSSTDTIQIPKSWESVYGFKSTNNFVNNGIYS
ncbi:hypothetical protein QEN19_001364 [Hanseniaspora menglaensis]